MPLIRDRLGHGATQYFTQAGHRQTAIEQAVHYVQEGFARSARENANDLLVSALSPNICEWVIETIYQGAYVREYHIWEKDCKEYFSAMGVQTKKRKQPKQRKQPKRGTFSRYVTGVLSSEGIVVPKDVMGALSTMEDKVGRMKHVPGVQNNEFVSAEDHGAAVAAIEQFWEFIGENETVTT
jgi:hypothetical protein